MDLVIVRENTEGFYADRNMHQGVGEFMPTPDLALSVRKISAHACRRIAVAAFELARTRRRKVTAVHKVNVLKVTEGLFLREVRKVAADYPDVACDEQLIDSMAALLVRDAARFDVVLTTNMYGDILSDEATELSGSLGLAASINAGDAHCMAQAQHGSAPDIAGQDRANPVSLILSAAILLGLARAKPPSSGFRPRAAHHRNGSRRSDQGARQAHRRPRRPARHQGLHRRAVRANPGVGGAKLNVWNPGFASSLSPPKLAEIASVPKWDYTSLCVLSPCPH